jgi:nitroreductase
MNWLTFSAAAFLGVLAVVSALLKIRELAGKSQPRREERPKWFELNLAISIAAFLLFAVAMKLGVFYISFWWAIGLVVVLKRGRYKLLLEETSTDTAAFSLAVVEVVFLRTFFWPLLIPFADDFRYKKPEERVQSER